MKNLIPNLVLVLIISACSSVKVTSDYDKNIDFSKYKTFEYYGWTEESDKILNRFDKERLENAFGQEFDRRGLELVSEGGDMVVSLFIVVDQKTSTTAYTNHYNMGGYGYGSGWGWYGGYGGMGMGTSTTTYSERDYLVGTLVVDVFDKADKKLIWQSVGQKTVDENPSSPEKNAAYIAKAIMKPFPIEPIKE